MAYDDAVGWKPHGASRSLPVVPIPKELSTWRYTFNVSSGQEIRSNIEARGPAAAKREAALRHGAKLYQIILEGEIK